MAPVRLPYNRGWVLALHLLAMAPELQLLPVYCRVDRKYQAEEVENQGKDHYSKSLVMPRTIDV